MPPKVKATKEAIVDAAVQIVRQQGEQAINARALADAMNCSTQPIFSNFATMDELRLAVVAKADEMCNDYITREIATGQYPEYKASGMAYIRFAKEEKELFKLLYMRDRSRETTSLAMSDRLHNIVQTTTGLKGQSADLFHLEMWAYVHGIATMFATGFFDMEWELVARMVTDVYQGLRKQYAKE